MAHFAEISNGVVQQVVVVHNNELLVDDVEVESKGAEFCANLFGGTWIQTSYNNNIRKQYAGIGYTHDADADEFVAPQPFASWSLDANNDWQPPTPMPSDASFENRYEWNEAELAWVAI